jgi:miniconductance mechanosensitive channel
MYSMTAAPSLSLRGIPVLAQLPAWAETLIALALLGAIAWGANFVVKRIALRYIMRRLPVEGAAPISARLANIVPALIVAYGIRAVPNLPAPVGVAIGNVVAASIILFLALAIGAALSLANQIYERRPEAAHRPIKGYVQVLKIVLYLGAAILIVAALMEQSPLLLLSGLGAMAAVLMLVFKDTILSLVASVQLTSNDMLRVGDWIDMPQLHADGAVIDIALHTVKVQNWDKTVTTIPTHRLIQESYKNWRGMAESGGRRIKRALLIDQNCVRFLTEAERDRMADIALVHDHIDRKRGELAEWNARLGPAAQIPANQRRVTNIGTFRAYVLHYLRANPRVAQDMTLIVRQLAPTPQGIPIEIYCFTATTMWVEYEDIQADIFDHLIAILPEFGLRAFQEPSGVDLRMIGARADAA